MLLCVILNHLVLPLLINKRLTQGIPASHCVYPKTHDVYILQKVTSIYIRFNIKHLAQTKSSTKHICQIHIGCDKKGETIN